MTKQSTKPLRAAAIGIEERTRNALRLMFYGQYQNRCILTKVESADIGIIDLDTFGGKDLWIKHRHKYPDRPVILLSLTQTDIDGALFVVKPIRPEQLISALDEAREQIKIKATTGNILKSPAQNMLNPALASAYRTTTPTKPPPLKVGASQTAKLVTQHQAGIDKPSDFDLTSISKAVPGGNTASVPVTKSDYAVKQEHAPSRAATSLSGDQPSDRSMPFMQNTDPRNPKSLTERHYQPKHFLQGHVQNAVKMALEKNLAIRLEGIWRPITVLPNTRQIHVEQNARHLRPLCLLPQRRTFPEWRRDAHFIVLEKYPSEVADQTSALHSIEAFVWMIALWTSRGRVPKDTSLESPVILRRWPNLTRLLPTPNALRIAALWMQSPRSLLSTVAVLGIPCEQVFAFYSAATAIGLIEQGEQDVQITETSKEEKPTQHSQHGLLRRIMNRLKKAS